MKWKIVSLLKSLNLEKVEQTFPKGRLKIALCSLSTRVVDDVGPRGQDYALVFSKDEMLVEEWNVLLHLERAPWLESNGKCPNKGHDVSFDPSMCLKLEFQVAWFESIRFEVHHRRDEVGHRWAHGHLWMNFPHAIRVHHSKCFDAQYWKYHAAFVSKGDSRHEGHVFEVFEVFECSGETEPLLIEVGVALNSSPRKGSRCSYDASKRNVVLVSTCSSPNGTWSPENDRRMNLVRSFQPLRGERANAFQRVASSQFTNLVEFS